MSRSDGLPEGLIAACAKCKQEVFVSANGWLRCGRCNLDYRTPATRRDGFVEVPREPTEAMIARGVARAAWQGNPVEASERECRRIYAAMLAAVEPQHD